MSRLRDVTQCFGYVRVARFQRHNSGLNYHHVFPSPVVVLIFTSRAAYMVSCRYGSRLYQGSHSTKD